MLNPKFSLPLVVCTETLTLTFVCFPDAEMQAAMEVSISSGEEKISRESQLYDGGVQLGFPWWIREHGALQNQIPSQYIVPSSSSSSSSSNDHASLMNNAEAFFPSQRQNAEIQASDSSGTLNLLPSFRPKSSFCTEILRLYLRFETFNLTVFI